MVIRPDDRVADVLARDERLVDVFVSVSSHFNKLRNPTLRKVMARLVTVEQAARVAGVDAVELLGRLNRALGLEAEAAAGERRPPLETAELRPLPAHIATLPAERIVDLDVREDLGRGAEPFSRIMEARRRVPAGGVLRLRAPFEPAPLYAVMARYGFERFTERLSDDDWRVWFVASGRSSEPEASPAVAGEDVRHREQGDDIVVLDVRGLEPPEPMVRTLEALERLPPGASLEQVNQRVPRFLLPLLEQRGYAWEVREEEPDLVRVLIRRAPPIDGESNA